MWFLEVLGIGFFALIIADFFSGLIHWFADSYGSVKWPMIGPGLIQPFREHHVNPRSILEHNFWETNGSTIGLCLLVLPIAFILPGPLAKLWAVSCCIGAFTNQFHKLAHKPKVNKFEKALLSSKLVLNRTRHGKHHRPPRRQSYCITCGWLNPILDKVSFFLVLEKIILAITGVKPSKT